MAAVNKIDLVKNHSSLIPFLERLSKTREFAAIVPVSAKTGDGIPELRDELVPMAIAVKGRVWLSGWPRRRRSSRAC